jgi:hypothetical protein
MAMKLGKPTVPELRVVLLMIEANLSKSSFGTRSLLTMMGIVDNVKSLATSGTYERLVHTDPS